MYSYTQYTHFIVITVQTKLKNYLTGMKGRMTLLRALWDNEHKNMLISLSKVKNKSKKQKEFFARLKAIPDTVKESILQRYMDKCKNQNAVEFFNWYRRLYGEKGNPYGPKDRGQSLIISLRLNRIRKHENNLFTNTEETHSLMKDIKKDDS